MTTKPRTLKHIEKIAGQKQVIRKKIQPIGFSKRKIF